MYDFYDVAGRGKMGFDLDQSVKSDSSHCNISGLCSFFSEEDDNFLRENIDKMPYRTLADKLGRTRNSIAGRVRRLGLSAPTTHRSLSKSRRMVVSDSRGLVQKIAKKQFVIKTGNSSRKPATPLRPDQIVSTEFFCDLMSLDNHSCRWPIGDPRTEEFRYCGIKEAVFPFSPYCRFHSRMNYAPR